MEIKKRGITMRNVEKHENICKELNALYEAKNADYGDSFHLSYLEEGLAMARIRLSDKLNRFKTLTKGQTQNVNDESIRDTLLDLANYAIMTIMEISHKSLEETKETAQIVHCNDCEHAYFKDMSGYCAYRMGQCSPDGFCEHGTRKY